MRDNVVGASVAGHIKGFTKCDAGPIALLHKEQGDKAVMRKDRHHWRACYGNFAFFIKYPVDPTAYGGFNRPILQRRAGVIILRLRRLKCGFCRYPLGAAGREFCN